MTIKRVFAIGNFDGVHKGHQKIINRVLEIATENNLRSNDYGIITFEPHPAVFFNKASKFLITPYYKVEKLKSFGIYNIISLPFGDIYQMSHEEFFEDILIKQFQVDAIITGDNFCFGKDRLGNVETLTALSRKQNIVYEALEELKIAGIPCSSSNIRHILKDGDVFKAKLFLGYNFTIFGKVIHGNQLGRQLGFPTANIEIPNYAQLKHGVYIVNALIDGEIFPAVANFGVRPSIEHKLSELLEVHILDYNEELYDKIINIDFLHHIREEKKFNSLDELKINIHKDVDTTRAYFKNNKGLS